MVLVVLGALLRKAFLGAGGATGKRAALADRLAVGSFAALVSVVSLLVTVIAVANAGTALDPEPALLAFFNGSW